MGVLGAGLVVSSTWREHWGLLLLVSAIAGGLAGLAAIVVVSSRARSSVQVIDVPLKAAASIVRRPVRASAFSLPKEGTSQSDNEDAHGVNEALGVAAISDGASSSFDSARWARALCDAFAAAPPQLEHDRFTDWVVRTSAGYRAAGAASGADWWGSATSGRTSHATFVGVQVGSAGEGIRWSALAVGDSVAVQVRRVADGAHTLVDGFPIDRSGGFSGEPWLLSSSIERAEEMPPVRVGTGSARTGDVLLVMTDELARWSLARDEAARPVWDLLVGSDADLAATIAAERAAGAMVNDDMTLVRVSL